MRCACSRRLSIVAVCRLPPRASEFHYLSVSRLLSSLERELGVRLIARTTRGLTETDAGRLYYRRCLAILEGIREADSAVQAHARAPAGELRLTAPVTFGRYHVAPSMAEFLERYPRLSFYLLLSDHCESLTEQRLDVAIRVAVLQKDSVIARRLGYVQRAVVGSREYFSRHPAPSHPATGAARLRALYALSARR